MDQASLEPPAVCVLATWPIVSVTVERPPDDGKDIYFNAAGQGIWIARMALALGANSILCGPFAAGVGALNVNRRGRGTGTRADAKEIARLVEVRRCEDTA